MAKSKKSKTFIKIIYFDSSFLQISSYNFLYSLEEVSYSVGSMLPYQNISHYRQHYHFPISKIK